MYSLGDGKERTGLFGIWPWIFFYFSIFPGLFSLRYYASHLFISPASLFPLISFPNFLISKKEFVSVPIVS